MHIEHCSFVYALLKSRQHGSASANACNNSNSIIIIIICICDACKSNRRLAIILLPKAASIQHFSSSEIYVINENHLSLSLSLSRINLHFALATASKGGSDDDDDAVTGVQSAHRRPVLNHTAQHHTFFSHREPSELSLPLPKRQARASE